MEITTTENHYWSGNEKQNCLQKEKKKKEKTQLFINIPA